MATAKRFFPLVYWRKAGTLFTIGGSNGSGMKEVTEYSIEKNCWSIHSQLPEAMFGSSAVILNDDAIYNIGGYPSTHSVIKCDLNGEPEWNPVEILEFSYKN